jgi:hypothetical protein
MQNQIQSSHMNPTTMLNQTINMNNTNTLAAHHQQHGMPPGHPSMYDHMLNLNGIQKGPSEFIYLNQQHAAPPPHHMNQLAAQNQYLPSRNNVSGHCFSLF